MTSSREYLRPKGPATFATLPIFLGILVLGTVSVQTEDVPPEVRRFLGVFDFNSADASAVGRGDIVTKVPDTGDAREVAIFGAVRVNVPTQFFVREFRDIESFAKGSSVPQVGSFGAPPRPQDLLGLRLPEEDARALRSCTVGACDVKLTADQIEELRGNVEPSAPDYLDQVDEVFRAILFDQLKVYLDGGTAALGEYRDKREPLSVAEGLMILLQKSHFLRDSLPEFYGYLSNYPKGPVPEVESFFYWSEENFGLKPVISLTHAVIYNRPPGSLARVVISEKQIYASHYFQAALTLTALVSVADGAAEPMTYVVFVNRARFDGKLSGLKRTVFKQRLRSVVDELLKSSRQKLEESYRAERAASSGGKSGTQRSRL